MAPTLHQLPYLGSFQHLLLVPAKPLLMVLVPMVVVAVVVVVEVVSNLGLHMALSLVVPLALVVVAAVAVMMDGIQRFPVVPHALLSNPNLT